VVALSVVSIGEDMASRVVLLASSGARCELRCRVLLRASLAESGCFCPLAPDWRTAIARPIIGPRFNRFSI
jgi:hypothetical protein